MAPSGTPGIGEVVSATMTERSTGSGARGDRTRREVGPERPAIVFGDVVRTYGELDERARRLASVLAEKGAGPGRPVAGRAAQRRGDLRGGHGGGHARGPLPPGQLASPRRGAGLHPRRRRRGRRRRSASASTTSSTGGRSTIGPGIGLRVGAGYEEAIADAAPLPEAVTVGRDPSCMFYTSGTTARPKGVVHGGSGRRRGSGPGHGGAGGAVGLDRRRRLRDERSCLPRLASRLGACSLYVGATTVITEQFEARAWLDEVSRRAGHPDLHGAGPLHPDPRDPRRACGRRIDVTSLSLVVHAARPLPGAGEVPDDGGVPRAEIHELYGASEGGRHQDLARRSGWTGRAVWVALARGRDPHPRRGGEPGAHRRGRARLHPPGRTAAVPATATTRSPPAGPGMTTPSPWATSATSTRTAT